MGRDNNAVPIWAPGTISIHAPRMGRDVITLLSSFFVLSFQSTRPVWGATKVYLPLPDGAGISIHAPRMGRDASSHASCARRTEFQSTRPVWGATPQPLPPQPQNAFQSTRPVWGATQRQPSFLPTWLFQSTRPVWGATAASAALPPAADISIHAPRMGRDAVFIDGCFEPPKFQSTRPVWGATPRPRPRRRKPKFQSTRPVWGATVIKINQEDTSIFQSTRPVWGATNTTILLILQPLISIHAPRMGRDGSPPRGGDKAEDFNPRAPYGARPPSACAA